MHVPSVLRLLHIVSPPVHLAGAFLFSPSPYSQTLTGFYSIRLLCHTMLLFPCLRPLALLSRSS